MFSFSRSLFHIHLIRNSALTSKIKIQKYAFFSSKSKNKKRMEKVTELNPARIFLKEKKCEKEEKLEKKNANKSTGKENERMTYCLSDLLGLIK